MHRAAVGDAMTRIEVFGAVSPNPIADRAFVAVLQAISTNTKGQQFMPANMNFYGETASVAQAKAEQWVADERSRLAKQQDDAEKRRQARSARIA